MSESRTTLGLKFLALGLAVAAGLLLARRMTTPITALQAGAVKIGRGGLDHRIEVVCPIYDPRIRAELEHFVELHEQDTALSFEGLQSRVSDLMETCHTCHRRFRVLPAVPVQ